MFNKVSVKVIFSVVIPIVLLFSCICNEVLTGPIKPFERMCGDEIGVDSYTFTGSDFNWVTYRGETNIFLSQRVHSFTLDSVCQLERHRLKVVTIIDKTYDLNNFSIKGALGTSEVGNFNKEDVLAGASGTDDVLYIDSTSSTEFNTLYSEFYRSCEDGRYPFIHPDSIFSVNVDGILYFDLNIQMNGESLSIKEFHDNVKEIHVTLQAPLAE